jgi:hypothetical protein
MRLTALLVMFSGCTLNADIGIGKDVDTGFAEDPVVEEEECAIEVSTWYNGPGSGEIQIGAVYSHELINFSSTASGDNAIVFPSIFIEGDSAELSGVLSDAIDAPHLMVDGVLRYDATMRQWDEGLELTFSDGIGLPNGQPVEMSLVLSVWQDTFPGAIRATVEVSQFQYSAVCPVNDEPDGDIVGTWQVLLPHQ